MPWEKVMLQIIFYQGNTQPLLNQRNNKNILYMQELTKRLELYEKNGMKTLSIILINME